MTTKKMLILMMVPFLFLNCEKIEQNEVEPTSNLSQLFGEYLGQTAPGTTPIRFAPDILLATTEWWWICPPKFSPNGGEMYFVKYIVGNPDTKKIYFMQMMENDQWTLPQEAPFSSNHVEGHVAFSRDGNKLYFLSQRPGGPFFLVNRTADGWSEPVPLNIAPNRPVGNQFSITGDETIYFEISDGQADDIYRSRPVNGVYGEPEYIGDNINTSFEEYAPFVAPDESYLIFASNRPGGVGGNDLYVSFRTPDGTWTEPKNMGESINSTGGDTIPCVSPDGNHLFFISGRPQDRGYNPYWVDAGIIDSYRD